MRISVIAHTRDLARFEDLPPRAQLAMVESDLILHVGNVGKLSFLNALQDHATLTFAVFGKDDSPAVQRYLEQQKVVEFANRRIGMTFALDNTEAGLRAMFRRGNISPLQVAEQALSLFNQVDCVLFGEPAEPFSYIYHGQLVFNPGPLYDSTGRAQSMGMLEISDRAITGRIVNLD